MRLFLLISLGAVVMYLFIIFPIWMMIKCARSHTSLTWKIIWIGLMLVLFGPGSYFYAFFGSEDLSDRMIASVVFTIVVFTYLLILPFQYRSMEFMKKNLLFQIRQVERNNLSEVDPAYAVFLRENLNTLKSEIQNCHFWDIKKQIKPTFLVLSLTQMMSDGEFSLSEYIDWTNQFETRHALSLKDLKKPLQRWKPVFLQILGMQSPDSQVLTIHSVASTLQPDTDYPFIGLWKEDCSQDYGIAIDKAEDRYYSIVFCGPERCYQPGEYRLKTTIENDPDYQIVNLNTLRIKSALGFETYHRCLP